MMKNVNPVKNDAISAAIDTLYGKACGIIYSICVFTDSSSEEVLEEIRSRCGDIENDDLFIYSGEES